jgi:hypothetical protein
MPTMYGIDLWSLLVALFCILRLQLLVFSFVNADSSNVVSSCSCLTCVSFCIVVLTHRSKASKGILMPKHDSVIGTYACDAILPFES